MRGGGARDAPRGGVVGGLFVYRSNRAEYLVEVLAQVLRAPQPDPFAPERIVVGSGGMAEWLREGLARRWGLCANVEMPFPAQAVEDLLRALGGAPAEARPGWSVDPLTWAVLAELTALAPGDEALQPLRRYLGDEAGAPPGRRQYVLARALADTLDRYAHFRPEMVRAWEAGAPTPGVAAWQAALWRRLVVRLGPGHWAWRAEQATAALGGPLRAQDLAAAMLPARLCVFGIDALPPAYVGLLAAVAARVEVHLFVVCPSNLVWADLHERCRGLPPLPALDRDALPASLGPSRIDGHPLLAAFGRLARDAQVVLESLSADYVDQPASAWGRLDHDIFADPLQGDVPSALRRLQSDLVHLRAPRPPRDDEPDERPALDETLQFHACHGPTRQVEVLRDVLLHLFAAHADLEPRDVLLVAPDVEAFAPLVSAVFAQGDRDSNPPAIPFAIAGLSVRRSNPFADVLLRVLALARSRVTAAEVLDLLGLGPVARRFGFDLEDAATFAGWVRDAGVRWGMDAAHRGSVADQPADVANSWRFGLERLLLGVVARGERLVEGVLPLPAVEGTAADRLGRLVDACNTLFAHLRALPTARPLAAWRTTLLAVMDDLTAAGPEESRQAEQVRGTLAGLAEAGAAAGHEGPVTLAAIQADLAGRFDGAGGARPAGNAVTLAGPEYARNVPYRVICLLGMDEGAFPRQGGGPAFDLLRAQPRPGDRDARDEDRALFLDTVLAARDALVVLYTGRDLRTNEPRPPAVPVSELMEVAQRTFRADPARMPWAHPLQAFSPANFLRDGSLAVPRPDAGHATSPFGFDPGLRDGAARLLGARVERTPFYPLDADPPPDPRSARDTIDLEDLIRFFRNPARYFLTTTLGVRAAPEADPLPDREPIELDGLARWSLADALVRAVGQGVPWEEAEDRLRAGGRLPLGTPGRMALAERRALAEAGLAVFAAQCSAPPTPLPIDLSLAGRRLVGRVDGVRGGAVASLDVGAEQGKRLIGPWIRLLAALATAPRAVERAVLVFAAPDRNKRPAATAIDLRPSSGPEPTEAWARARLGELLGLYEEGRRRPTLLFEATSYAFAAAGKARRVFEAFGAEHFRDGRWPAPPTPADLDALQRGVDETVRKWRGSDFQPGEHAEKHVARLFGDGPDPFDAAPAPLPPAFAELALTVWGPLLSARGELDS